MPLNPSELLVGQITAEEIKEFTHGFPQSHRTDTVSNGTIDAEMTFKVPGNKLKPFLQFALGVNYVDTNNNLRRSLPMFHPVHCWAWARQVRINGQQYDGDDVNAVIWDFQVTPAKWKQYECVVVFDIPRFPLYPDDEIDFEYERFVSVDGTGEVKIVTVDNGQVLYTAPGKAWNNQPHNATIPVARRDGGGFQIKWWHVPEEFVQATDLDFPEKWLMAQGRCNDATFFNKTTECLLLFHVKRERYVSPVMTDQIGKLYFLNDVEFNFLYVNQLAGDMGEATETLRGHNVLLGPEMKYWKATNTNGTKIVRPIGFGKLFTHYTDTYT